MKIIRNEQEIELAPEEMRQTYCEMQEQHEIEDIRSLYNLPDDKITEAIMLFEGIIGDNDSFWDLYWSTIEFIAKEMGLEEKED